MKTVIIEDSELARNGLIKIASRFTEIDVVASAENMCCAIEAINAHRPDLLFLDISMPGGSGFEVLKRLNYSPMVIFTTAYEEYAINSFEHNTIDYILKPVTKEKVSRAISKINHVRQLDISPTKHPKENDTQVFYLSKNGLSYPIEFSDILYFESCKNHSIAYTLNDKYFVHKNLSSVEQKLKHDHFFRVNRQFLINLNQVSELRNLDANRWEVKMHNNAIISISRRKKSTLKSMIAF